jgi:hypothetical protein
MCACRETDVRKSAEKFHPFYAAAVFPSWLNALYFGDKMIMGTHDYSLVAVISGECAASLIRTGRLRGLCIPPRRGSQCCQPSNAQFYGVRREVVQSSAPMFVRLLSTRSVRNRCLPDPWLCTRIGSVAAWCAEGKKVYVKSCEEEHKRGYLLPI